MKKIIFIQIVYLFLSHSYAQNVIRVPLNYPTIQGAIDAANGGDTIKVDKGVYTENISLTKNGITILSTSQREETIIDGSGTFTTFFCSGNNNLVKGFTIRNGKATRGGGIYCEGESHFINLVVEKNIALDAGGGIYSNGNSTFTEIIIRENYVERNYTVGMPTVFGGGGIYFSKNSNSILNNVVIENNSCQYGGGVMVGSELDLQGNPTFNNVTIIKNTSTGKGGGLYVKITGLELEAIKIIKNYAKLGGGGIYAPYDSLTLSNSIICNNKTDGEGGGINCANITRIINSTISFNVANVGGGIYITGIYPNFQSVAVTNNTANEGSGVFKTSQVGGNITNSNFLGNGYGVFNSTTAHLFDGRNNWWGDATGPFHPTQNSNGIGDTVNTYVNINPFSLTAFSETPPVPIQKISSNSIHLSWDPSPQNNILFYKLYYSTSPAEGYNYQNSIVVGNETNYILNNLEPSTKYYFTITCFNQNNIESWFAQEIDFTTNAITDVVEIENRPVNYNLLQNYPNPFNPTTKIQYSTPQYGFVSLIIYDILGKEVITLVDGYQNIGYHEVEFNAYSLASGIYFYTLDSGKFKQTKKMLLLR